VVALATVAHADPPLKITGTALVGTRFAYTIQPGDYLIRISARFAIPVQALVRDNALDPKVLIHPGTRLWIDNRHLVPDVPFEGLVVNIPQRMLFYFHEGALQAAYPVGLGKPDWPTPQGDFEVTGKTMNKTWRVPKSIQEEMQREGQVVRTEVPPGPDNPLGKYWLALSLPGVGIHGTIAPPSIYRFQSHGCIRLHPDDIETLFADVERGEPGSIVYRPALLAEAEGRVWLEVHEDIYHQSTVSLDTIKQLAEAKHLADRMNWARVADVLARQEGLARDVSANERD
jgi:L,D-transpeptidase ErfK/SrfK